MRRSIAGITAVLVLQLAAMPGLAAADPLDDERALANQGTVGVLAADADSTFTQLGHDMALALDHDNELRVLTILGKGSMKNVEDLLLLKGVDVAFTLADTLTFYQATNAYPGIERRLRFITKIHDEEFHLLARAEIGAIEELEGKRVNFSREGTGSFLTASVVFDRLGMTVEVTTHPDGRAYELLKAGEIDAMARVDGKPAGVITEAKLDDRVHLLPVPAAPLSDSYDAAVLSYGDYPALLAPGDIVETISVSSVLAAYNWPDDHERRARLDRLTEALFAHIDELKDPANGYAPKWADVDLAAEVPGWRRDRTAETLLTATQ
jgi:TRAP transporter TAXI family solute receptor